MSVDIRQVRDRAQVFVSEHVHELAKELNDWQSMTLLVNGHRPHYSKGCTVKRPRVQCPYRPKSIYGFNQDGLDCLSEGLVPSCHEIVDANLQFDDPEPPASSICAGYLAHQTGRKGLRIPVLAD